MEILQCIIHPLSERQGFAGKTETHTNGADFRELYLVSLSGIVEDIEQSVDILLAAVEAR